ncbi:MAG: immunoglobulin domain-containing protein [Chitinivibrionales bacterium]|nr:immunoglobulin domain-containing protein [Chitinivibrionales bacterium]
MKTQNSQALGIAVCLLTVLLTMTCIDTDIPIPPSDARVSVAISNLAKKKPNNLGFTTTDVVTIPVRITNAARAVGFRIFYGDTLSDTVNLESVAKKQWDTLFFHQYATTGLKRISVRVRVRSGFISTTGADTALCTDSLNIGAAPLFLNDKALKMSSPQAMAGQPFWIEAVLQEFGKTDVRWMKRLNDSLILIPGATIRLAFDPFTAVDTGSYRCVATNDFGSDSTKFCPVKLTKDTNTVLLRIVRQPQSLEVSVGSRAAFFCIAQPRSLNPRYQWYRNDQPIVNAVDTVFSIESVTLADNDSRFRCVVAGGGQILESEQAMLRVLEKPKPLVILGQPLSLAVKKGDSARFSIRVEGTNPQYQWQRAGVDIAGAVTDRLELPGVKESDDGTVVRCKVSNSVSSVMSDSAVLTVLWPPKILRSPSNVSVAEKQSASFSVSIQPGNPLSMTIEWLCNGALIAGANDSIYTIASAQLSDSNSRFKARVTNGAAEVESSEAVLFVSKQEPEFKILQNPADTTVKKGERAVFKVLAQGSGLVYQWQKNGIDIPAATGSSFEVPAALESDNGSALRCRVKKAVVELVSTEAILTVLWPPMVTKSPVSSGVLEGQTALFTLEFAPGNPAATSFAWFNQSGDTVGRTQELSVLGQKKEHGQRFAAIVRNSVGSAITDPAALEVYYVDILRHPQQATVAFNEPVVMRVSADAFPRSFFQWKKNGQMVTGATDSILSIAKVQISDSGSYVCEVSNGKGVTKATLAARLVVKELTIVIETPLKDAVVLLSSPDANGSATFEVKAQGSNLNYVWRKQGVVIAGAANAPLLTLTPVVKGDNGQTISCEVKNSSESRTTEAKLIVQWVPKVTALSRTPASGDIVEGTTVTMNATVDANPAPTSFQWLLNGASVTTTVTPVYQIANSLPSQSGTYTCTATNSVGTSAVSPSVAVKIVVARPEITVKLRDTWAYLFARDTTGNKDSLINPAVFTVNVNTKGKNVKCRWWRAGTELTSNNTTTLTLKDVYRASHNQTIRFRVELVSAPDIYDECSAKLLVGWIQNRPWAYSYAAKKNARDTFSVYGFRKFNIPTVEFRWVIDKGEDSLAKQVVVNDTLWIVYVQGSWFDNKQPFPYISVEMMAGDYRVGWLRTMLNGIDRRREKEPEP